MTSVVAPQAAPAPTIMMSPRSCLPSREASGTPNATTSPAKESTSPTHCTARSFSPSRNVEPSATKNGAV